MEVKISIESPSILEQYAKIPMTFKADTVFEVVLSEKGLGGLLLKERELNVPFYKDYDQIDGDGPLTWHLHFNLDNWGILVAKNNEEIVGGAAIAYNTPEVNMLENRSDLAVLWDIRVSPECKGAGVGHQLFQAVEKWAISRNCKTLKIETQNNNVDACRFYLRQGCQLGAINRFAYPDLPEEAQLLWYKSL